MVYMDRKIIGLLFSFLILVSVEAMPPLDDCLLAVNTQCDPNSPDNACPTGSRCIRGRCVCKLLPVCPSGVVGPACSAQEPCKPGYTCRGGYCCRDPVCPAGYVEGGSCNLLPGEQKCAFGYECINNFCCKPRIIEPPAIRCPIGYTQVPGRCQAQQTQVSRMLPNFCPAGTVCHNGICCRKILPIGTCPKVTLIDIRLCPVYKKSPNECENDFDCPNRGNLCCKDKCGVKYCYTSLIRPL